MRVLLICLSCCLLPAGVATAQDAAPQAGPVGPNTPPARWGACVLDEANKEWVWFGGTGGVSETGALRTMLLKDGQWGRWKHPSPPAAVTELEGSASPRLARELYAAVANRYYRCETEAAAKTDLSAASRDLLNGVGAGFKDTPSGAVPELDQAKQLLASLADALKNPPTVKDVAAARAAWMAMVRLDERIAIEPPPRCYPAMAYDGKTKKIILFGGESVHGVCNDTWVYDCQTKTWSSPRPKLAPPPRLAAGVAARDGRVYVVGGQEARGTMSYCGALWARLPFDVWVYNIAANSWTRLSAGEGNPAPTPTQPRVNATLSDDGKTLSWTADVISYGKKVKELAGSLELPGKDAGTADAGLPPDTIQVRGEGFDPAWYEDVPAPEPEKFAAFLKDLPANRWVNVNPPKRHVMRDWGTTVLDLAGDQLLHWSGGHSSHCGTDVAHYSPALNRWHILHTPELPFESCYSNDGAPVPTMSGRPWAPHTYLSYAWDQSAGKLLWTGKHAAYRLVNPGGTWLYDPAVYEWTWPQWKVLEGSFDPERHKTCTVRTPHGVAVWADKYGGSGLRTGLWLADVAKREYAGVAGTDPKDGTTLPPPAFGDRHGIAYDSKRDRVLIFHFGIKDKSKVWAVDLKTKAVTVLTPKGSAGFPEDANMAREATYLPDDDLVLVPSGGKPAQHTLVYDCAADAWLELPGAFATDAKGRTDPAYSVSSGVEWDPKRKLLWHVDSPGNVHAMRFDRGTAEMKSLPE